MPRKRTTDGWLSAVRLAGIVRPRDLAPLGLSRTAIKRLVERGVLQRLARGLYSAADAEITEHHSLAEAARRVPRGVVCLLSALRFHGLTTQNPFEVWMAIGHKAWRPQAFGPPLRLVHMSQPQMASGVEVHVVEGVAVRVFGPAKTVVDCFRYRNRVGLDVAVEALRDFRRLHRGGMDDVWRFARAARVSRVMLPYVEALP